MHGILTKTKPFRELEWYDVDIAAHWEKRKEIQEKIDTYTYIIVWQKKTSPKGSIPSKVNDSVVKCYGNYVTNDNGEGLIHLCEQQVLKITKGWFSNNFSHHLK